MWVCTGKLGALLLLFYMVFLRFVPSKSDRLIKYAPTLIGLFAPEIGLFVNPVASSFLSKGELYQNCHNLIKNSQELRMLSSVTINCQVDNDSHEFRFSIVRIAISVSNVTSLQDCLFKCQNCKKKIVWIVSVVKIVQNYKELSKIVEIIQNCWNCPKLLKIVQNC